MKQLLFSSILMAMGIHATAGIITDDLGSLKRNDNKNHYESMLESKNLKNQPYLINHKQYPMHKTVQMNASAYVQRLDSIVNVGNDKQIFTYNEYGRRLSAEYLTWNAEKNAWIGNTLKKYTYNANNLITSELYMYGDSNGEYVNNSLYYDNFYDEEQNRIISGSAYWNDEVKDWYYYWIQIQMLDDQGRVTSYAFYEGWDDESWQPSYLNTYIEYEYLEDGIVQQISYDSNHLPLEKKIFKYDEQHDYYLHEEVYKYNHDAWIPYSYVEQLREYYGDNSWDYRTVYNENLSNYNEATGWGYGNKKISDYDDHGSLILNDVFIWNTDLQQWENRSHTEYSYQYDSDYTKTLREVNLYNWDYTYNTWCEGYLNETEYDEYNNMSYNASANWSMVDQDWEYNYRIKYERQYNAEGRMTEEVTSTWNTSTKSWNHPEEYNSWEYGDNGLLTVTRLYSYMDDKWYDGYKEAYIKDNQGNYTYHDYYIWHNGEQRFIPNYHSEDQYLYIEDNGWTLSLHTYSVYLFDWSDSNNSWNSGYKSIYEYDDQRREIKQMQYGWVADKNDFELQTTTQHQYDEQGYVTFYQYDQYGNYDYHEKWTRQYDENGNIIEQCEYNYDNETQTYWKHVRKVYSFDLTIEAGSVMGLRDLYFSVKPLSSLVYEYDQEGNEIMLSECYYYYSNIEGGEGVQQVRMTAQINVADGRVEILTPDKSAVSVYAADGKLMGEALNTCHYNVSLPAGTYVISVNGVSKTVRVK